MGGSVPFTGRVQGGGKYLNLDRKGRTCGKREKGVFGHSYMLAALGQVIGRRGEEGSIRKKGSVFD